MGHKRPPTRQRIWPLMKERARALRHQLTNAELILWRSLRGEQLMGYKFRRQQTFGSYIADFVSLDAKLIVELDGGQHADAADYDTRRDASLVSEGFRVLRFWNSDVIENLEGVLMNIAAALSPPPQHSPLEGEGDRQVTSSSWKGAKQAKSGESKEGKSVAALEGEGRTT